MYEKTDKRRIYQLIDMYLSGGIKESDFCNEFYYSYDLELDCDTLTEDERKAFDDLSKTVDWFSEFEEDIKKYPGTYYAKEDLIKKIIETKERLSKYFNELKKPYEKTDKRRIYQLIDLYLSDIIDESTFCYDFYCSYNLELNCDRLTEEESKAFFELSEIAIRFSELEEAIKKHPNAYSTKEELREKMLEIKKKLEKYFEEAKPF